MNVNINGLFKVVAGLCFATAKLHKSFAQFITRFIRLFLKLCITI